MPWLPLEFSASMARPPGWLSAIIMVLAIWLPLSAVIEICPAGRCTGSRSRAEARARRRCPWRESAGGTGRTRRHPRPAARASGCRPPPPPPPGMMMFVRMAIGSSIAVTPPPVKLRICRLTSGKPCSSTVMQFWPGWPARPDWPRRRPACPALPRRPAIPVLPAGRAGPMRPLRPLRSLRPRRPHAPCWGLRLVPGGQAAPAAREARAGAVPAVPLVRPAQARPRGLPAPPAPGSARPARWLR